MRRISPCTGRTAPVSARTMPSRPCAPPSVRGTPPSVRCTRQATTTRGSRPLPPGPPRRARSRPISASSRPSPKASTPRRTEPTTPPAADSHRVAAFGTVRAMADDDATAFVLRLGRALHALGYSSHRIEEMLADAAERLGLQGQFFTTPTSIFSAFGAQERQRTFLVRVEPGDLHLERLGRVQEIAEQVLAGRLDPRAGVAALDA